MDGVHARDACQQFKIDALKCQELISETDCFYERRVILNHDRTVLEDFVCSAIYGDEKRSFKMDFIRIQELVDLIIDINRRCDLSRGELGEIHYGVVFVFGFRVLDQEIFKIPVFKIFSEDNKNPLYVTIDKEFHKCWDEFLNYMSYTKDHFVLSYPAEGKYSNSVLFSDVTPFACLKYSKCLKDCMIEVNLKNMIKRYSSLNASEMKECEVNETVHKIFNKLIATIGSSSPDRALEDVMKMEGFVDSMIFCKVIEKLKLQWGLYMFWNLKTADENELMETKNNALIELSEIIDQGEMYERFKHFWIDHKRLLFLNRNDCYDIYTFKHTEKREADLKMFIHEIIHDNFYFEKVKDDEIDYLRITLQNSGLNAVIFFYEIFPNDVLCFLLVPKAVAEESQIGNLEKPFTDTSGWFDNDVDMEENSAKTENSIEVPEDFKAEAIRQQDFIAKTEGIYDHRILLKPDEVILQKFVSLVTFGFEGVESLEKDESRKKELEIVKNMVSKIIKQNEKFDKHRRFAKEIHYGAVHIIGYKINEKNEEKKMYKVPLFKIFKKKGDEDALFIDIDLNVYQNWDDFIKTNILPKSFLCVPKNGIYKISKETGDVELDFVETPKYWNTRRIVGLSVGSVFLVGSAALAAYTGPIGIALTTPVRLGIAGFGGFSSCVGIGVSLHKRKMKGVDDLIQKYQHSISFVINVSLEILTLYAEGSVLAGCATTILTGGAIGIGAYLIIRLTYDAIVKFIETGKIDMVDVWNIVNAALLFGNGILKFDTVVKFIRSRKFYQKLPSFKQIRPVNEEVTECIANVSSWLRMAHDIKRNPRFERAFYNLYENTKAWWGEKKSLEEFECDLANFGVEMLHGTVESIWPLLKSYIFDKCKVDVDKLLGEKAVSGIFNACRPHVTKYLIFRLDKFSTAKKQRNDIIKAIDENIPNSSNGKVSEMMNEGIEKAKTELVGKLVPDSDDEKTKLEKTIQAENFIESTVLKNEIQRLKICLDDSIKPNEEKIKECFETAVDDTIAQAGTSEFNEKFEEYCENEENLILLEEDETSSLYVFKYKGEECLNDVVRQIDENFKNNLVKVAENIYSYISESKKTVTVFLDKDDPNDVIGYVLIYS